MCGNLSNALHVVSPSVHHAGGGGEGSATEAATAPGIESSDAGADQVRLLAAQMGAENSQLVGRFGDEGGAS